MPTDESGVEFAGPIVHAETPLIDLSLYAKVPKQSPTAKANGRNPQSLPAVA
jgi:hypothetical protein